MKLLYRWGTYIAVQFDEGGKSYIVIASSPDEFVDVLFSKVMGGNDHIEMSLDLSKETAILKRNEGDEQ